MRCDRILDGSLVGAGRDALARHLEECPDCRDLLAALAAGPAEDIDLTASILERTTGSACESARERLCAWVDCDLDPLDAALVGGHLDRCAGCASLVRALQAADADLPRLAEVDPGPQFLAQVLARTSRRPRPVPLWQRLLDRPRIALEGAFVGAMSLAMIFSGLAPEDAIGTIRHAWSTTAADIAVRARSERASAQSYVAEHAAGLVVKLKSLARSSGTSGPSGASREGKRAPESAQED